MLRSHMILATLLVASTAADAADPAPEIRRAAATPQALGVVHTLRTIPEACARLEGQFTRDAAAPYKFAVVRTSERCAPRAKLVDAKNAKASVANGWLLNDVIRVPDAAVFKAGGRAVWRKDIKACHPSWMRRVAPASISRRAWTPPVPVTSSRSRVRSGDDGGRPGVQVISSSS